MAGARGPKPEPAAIKIAKGNPGKRRIGADPVEMDAAPSGVRRPPTLTKAQGEIWDQFAPDLERLKLLKSTDVALFTRYCVYLAQWYEAERKTRNQALVITTKSKHVTMQRVNGNLAVMLRLDMRLTDIEDRFGMNPSARQRIFREMAATPPPSQAQMPLEQAMQGPQIPTPPPASKGPLGVLMN